MGALGPEAIKFIKDICNYFPNNIRAQLKCRMKILLSTYIRRGKRFATEAIRNRLPLNNFKRRPFKYHDGIGCGTAI